MQWRSTSYTSRYTSRANVSYCTQLLLLLFIDVYREVRSIWMETTFRCPIIDHVLDKMVAFRYWIFYFIHIYSGEKMELESSKAICAIDMQLQLLASYTFGLDKRKICIRIREAWTCPNVCMCVAWLRFSYKQWTFYLCFNRSEYKNLWITYSWNCIQNVASHLVSIRVRK